MCPLFLQKYKLGALFSSLRTSKNPSTNVLRCVKRGKNEDSVIIRNTCDWTRNKTCCTLPCPLSTKYKPAVTYSYVRTLESIAHGGRIRHFKIWMRNVFTEAVFGPTTFNFAPRFSIAFYPFTLNFISVAIEPGQRIQLCPVHYAFITLYSASCIFNLLLHPQLPTHFELCLKNQPRLVQWRHQVNAIYHA